MTVVAVPCAALLALVSLSASAQTYPVSAELRLAPREAQQCVLGDREPDCRIIGITRDAFARAFARLFRQSEKPELIFTLRVRRAEIARVAGLQFDLDVEMTVESPAGERIEEIRANGFANLLTLDEGPIRSAEQGAAEQTVEDFERTYQSDAAISEYLTKKHVGAAASVAVFRRGTHHFQIVGGIGLVSGAGDDDVSFAPAARIALTYEWFFAQAMFAHWSAFVVGGTGPNGAFPATLDMNDLGFEAGVALRPTPTIDIRLGAGLHALFGTGAADSGGQPSSSFSDGAPSLYASVSKSFVLGRSGVALVFGGEARGIFTNDVTLAELHRTIGAGNFYFGGFFGIELPFGNKTDGR